MTIPESATEASPVADRHWWQKKVHLSIATLSILTAGTMGSARIVTEVSQKEDLKIFTMERDLAAMESHHFNPIDVRLFEGTMQTVGREFTDNEDLQVFCATPSFERELRGVHRTNTSNDESFVVINWLWCVLMANALEDRFFSDRKPLSQNGVAIAISGTYAYVHELGHEERGTSEYEADCFAVEYYKKVSTALGMTATVINADMEPLSTCL